MTSNTELGLVQRFHSLSQNYETRPAIARRNTLPTLSRFLTNKERNVRKLALEAVYMLSQHPDNVELLANELPITDGVFSIYKEAQYDDPELHELSSNTLDCLCVALPGGDPRRAEVLRRAAEEGRLSAYGGSHSRATSMGNRHSLEREDAVNDYGLDGDPAVSASGAAGTRYAMAGPSIDRGGVGNQSSHVVTLNIPALNTRTDTSDLETILQETKGVLSYTLSPAAHQVRVFMAGRALVPLQEALTMAGYVNLVVSDDRIARQSSVGSVQGGYYDDENENGAQRPPSYLQSARSFASNLFNAVVMYSGDQGNTLAGRMQRQRELDQNVGNRTADRLAKAFANWW